MNIQQIEVAKKKSANLAKFHEDSCRIEQFINEMKETPWLSVKAVCQFDLLHDTKKTFELIGPDLIELLERKLVERREYIEGLSADDLIVVEGEQK